MSKRERRFLEAEIRLSSGDSPKITGYAAVFGKRSNAIGSFVEVIDRHAFDDHLATNPDVVALYNHSNDMILGRSSAGTLRLSVDDYGLQYEIDPPNTSYARDLMESMRRKDIRSSSFAFYADADDWSIDPEDRSNVRTVVKARLVDVSPVTSPAYPDATSQLRAMFPDGQDDIKRSLDVLSLTDDERYKRYLKMRLSCLHLSQ